MSFQITDAFVSQYSSNLYYLAQQMAARLRGTTLEQPMTGELAYFEQIAPRTAKKVTARHADSPFTGTQHLRRRLTAFKYNDGDYVDRMDQMEMLIDPTSGYANAISMALARGQDAEIIAAFFGTAYTGHSGGTSITWPNGNSESTPTTPAGTQVAVSDWTYGTGTGNAGLTISKIISAAVALDAAEGDENEERYLCLTAKQLGNLLATTEATNADYNSVQALVNGKLDRFMGFKIIRSQQLLTNSSSQTRCVAWRKSGMGFGIAQDITGRIAERPDKSFSYYVYGEQMVGATRLEEAKVVEIICA